MLVSPDHPTTSVPLVVDLDGTLSKTDLLYESFVGLLGRHPLRALGAIAALTRGKAAMKARLAGQFDLAVGTLPLDDAVLAMIRTARAEGRAVYLASASDRRYVDALARHLGLFDGVFSSDGTTNLSGPAKARALVDAFGVAGFDYAGNSLADCAVWTQARQAIVVNPTRALAARLARQFPDMQVVGQRRAEAMAYVKALRAHQWLKNILVFVPPLAAHHFGTAVIEGIVTFVSFCLCSSSVYLLNDLLDLRADRSHPTKCLRPFASGRLPLVHGLLLVPLLLAASLAVACLLSADFILVLLGYYALTLGYSLRLKRALIIDVVVLTCLYGVRLAAGSVAMMVPLSQWLMALAFFLFLCLALVKRCTELIHRAQAGTADQSGRAYQAEDLPMLEAMAAASGYVSVLVLALYINSPAVTALYRHPQALWLICVVQVYWLNRILILTRRGDMRDDPVIFAVTDTSSLICGCLATLLMAVSI